MNTPPPERVETVKQLYGVLLCEKCTTHLNNQTWLERGGRPSPFKVNKMIGGLCNDCLQKVLLAAQREARTQHG